MKATSGLSSDCLRFVGRSLTARLEYGWGWSVQEDYGKQSRQFEEIYTLNGKTASFIPRRFYRHYGVLRAFKADVGCPGHSIDGMEALAFSLGDGFDWDFSRNVCPLWGFLFGKGEPHFPFWKSPYPWPMMFKNDIIKGCGADMKETEPHKAMETTPVAVTIPAYAGIAPSTSVSHL